MNLTVQIDGTPSIQAFGSTQPKNITNLLLGKSGVYRFKCKAIYLRCYKDEMEINCAYICFDSLQIAVDEISIDYKKHRIIARIDKKEVTK